jgi:hypothetical protein
MPNTQLGQIDVDFVNSLKATATMGGSTSGLNTPVNYSSISALDAALQGLNGAYYTTARLDSLTVNDKVFALRSIQDKTTISDYQVTSTA